MLCSSSDEAKIVRNRVENIPSMISDLIHHICALYASEDDLDPFSHPIPKEEKIMAFIPKDADIRRLRISYDTSRQNDRPHIRHLIDSRLICKTLLMSST